MKTADQRFWEKVSGNDVAECWIWTGGRGTTGYGNFITAWPKRTVAHRWAYQQLITDVPAGLDLDHLCRNRACVNPWHLDPVTRKVNLNRGVHANAVKDRCPQGHTYSPENTRMHSGRRECRACERRRNREAARHRRAAQKLADAKTSASTPLTSSKEQRTS